jgi:hypothetical protein
MPERHHLAGGSPKQAVGAVRRRRRFRMSFFCCTHTACSVSSARFQPIHNRIRPCFAQRHAAAAQRRGIATEQ